MRRPPDWRWQRAGEVMEHNGQFSRSRDDSIVRTIYKFRKLLNRCRTEEDKLIALEACPALYEAYSLYDSSEDPTEHRWELEARLLAQEPFRAIEAKMGIDASTVEWYEKVFFDVLSRLSYPSLIIHTVIGRSVHFGLAERDYDVLWKLFGYFAGAHVLDALIYKFLTPSHVAEAGGVKAFWKDYTRDQIHMKSGITILTTPINWQTRELIFGVWQRLLEAETELGQAGGAAETLTQNITAMVEAFGWSKHRPGVDMELTGRVAELEASGVRLRAAELTMIGADQEPVGLAHLLTTAKFPSHQYQDENKDEGSKRKQ